MTAVIRTEQLAKKFRASDALAGVTFEVPAGSAFLLLGPNGAGKTTAIKILMNLLEPTSGYAEVLGVDSRRLAPSDRVEIGYVSENRQLPDWMRVGYFLSYCKGFYPNWNDNDAAELTRRFALPLDRPLKALSRGMRIKVAVAAALSYRPHLIVLDEPFGGLDVLVRDQLIESILERTPESTVFLASHDLSEIESFATHVAYIDEGKLRFVEELGALCQRFREIEVVLERTAALPDQLPSTWLNPEASSAVVRFTHSAYEPDQTDAEVRRTFSGIREISVRTLTLRSIFIALAKLAQMDPSR